MNLGVIQKIDLRYIWLHEALDFTRWLGKEENIALLSDELDIALEDIKLEEATGRYNVDIVAKEINTQRTVIIENQLETTDHKHLGQILTYASAHEASIIIWIVKDYNEEHKQAIDWFNRHMPEEISFFLVQLELWQIGTSLPAPRFNIICEPNNWAKTIKVAGTIDKAAPTNLKLQQQRFWEAFKNYVSKHPAKTNLNLGRTPRTQHWYDISFGTSKANISLTFNSRQNQVGCELYIKSDQKIYTKIEGDKVYIESQLGDDLNWLDLPESLAFRIVKYHPGDPTDESKWPEYFQWFKENAEKFQLVFKKYF
jgi:hypothetical protein